MKTHLTTIARRQQETAFQELIADYRAAMAALTPVTAIQSQGGRWVLTRNGIETIHETYQDAVHALTARERSDDEDRAA